jgi:hypothetical protein
MSKGRFPVGAGPGYPLDLVVDLLMLTTDPPTHLLSDPRRAAAWWAIPAGSCVGMGNVDSLLELSDKSDRSGSAA